MSLFTKKGRDLPEGAIKLTEEQALAHQKSTILKWPSEFDVFFLKYAHFIAGATTAFSSVLILNHIKRSLNANWKILMFSSFPAIIIPSYISALGVESRVTNNTLLMKMNCPVCQQIKFALHQCFCSMVLPTLYGIPSIGVYAIITKSYPFPDIRKYPVEHWKEYLVILKKGRKTYQFLGLLQVALILLLPVMQAKELLHITGKLKEENDGDPELLQA